MRPCSSPAMPASDEVDIIYVNIYRQDLMSDTILSINVYKICKKRVYHASRQIIFNQHLFSQA